MSCYLQISRFSKEIRDYLVVHTLFIRDPMRLQSIFILALPAHLPA